MQDVTLYTESMRDQIYDILKTEILNGELKSGEQLVEQAIADRFHASRSPVREAIMQLIGDGLVINIKNRGNFVKRPTAQDLWDIQEIKAMIESFAIRKVIRDFTPEKRVLLEHIRDELVQCRQGNDGRWFLLLEQELFNSIVFLSRNMYLKELYQKYYGMITNFQRTVLAKPPRSFRESINERIAIVEAILASDMETAVSMTERHAAHSAEILCRAAGLQDDRVRNSDDPR